LAGNREQLPANGSAPRANALTAPHHPAKGTESATHAVMYLLRGDVPRPVRKVRGDKEWEANCCLYVGFPLLIPLTL
jgi:hypothetical protein